MVSCISSRIEMDLLDGLADGLLVPRNHCTIEYSVPSLARPRCGNESKPPASPSMTSFLFPFFPFLSFSSSRSDATSDRRSLDSSLDSSHY